MATVILKATNIDDVDAWKRGFDENAARRRRHGFLSYVLYRDPMEAGTIVVVSQVESLDKARGIAGDVEIREVMIRAGAKGPPEMMFLEEVTRG
jgi:hypothetical protein